MKTNKIIMTIAMVFVLVASSLPCFAESRSEEADDVCLVEFPCQESDDYRYFGGVYKTSDNQLYISITEFPRDEEGCIRMAVLYTDSKSAEEFCQNFESSFYDYKGLLDMIFLKLSDCVITRHIGYKSSVVKGTYYL